MKEDKDQQMTTEISGMYEYLTEKVVLKIYIDPLVTIADTVGDRGSDNFFFRLFGKLFKKKVKTNLDRKFRIVNLNIISSPSAKLFNFLKMSMEKTFEMRRKYEEIDRLNEDKDPYEMIIEVYEGLYGSFLGVDENDDEIIRLILDDIKLEDGFDFIPLLNTQQRRVIVETFWKVNPMLKEADEKVGEQIKKRLEAMDLKKMI